MAFLLVLVCATVGYSQFTCSDCDLENVPECGADVPKVNARVFKPEAFNSNPFWPKRQFMKVALCGGGDPCNTKGQMCTINGARSTDCEAMCSTTPENCDGDEDYCKVHTCKSGAQCSCKIVGLFSANYGVRQNGTEEKGSLVDCGVHYNAAQLEESNRKRQVASISTNVDAYVSLENYKLNFNIVPATSVTIRMSTQGWAVLFTTSNSSFQYSLPDFLRNMDATVHVEVWSSQGLLRERDFPIQRTSCAVQNNCVICWDVVDNWNCVPTTIKVFFSLFAILALILMASLIPLVAWLIGTAFALARWALCGLWKIGRNAHNTKLGKMAIAAGKKTAEYMTPEEEADLEAAQQQAVQRGGPGGRLNARYSWMIVACICISGVSACDNTISGAFSVQNCVQNGVNEDCNVQFNTVLTIPSIGSTSCAKFQTPTKNELNLEVKWVMMEELAVPSFAYSTCNWRGHVYASTQCPATTHCSLTGGDDCTSLTSNNVNAYGLLAGVFINNPGRTSCDSGAGWPFSCFFTGTTCQYSRYVIEPLSDAEGECYDVYKVNSYYRWGGINVVIRDEKFGVIANDTLTILKDPFTATIDLNNGGGVPFTIKTLGEFQDTSSSAGLRYIVRNQHTKETRESSASEPGSPVKGTIGDIQNQNGHFIPPNTFDPNAFLFDPSIATKRSIDHYTDYTFEQSGISRMWPLAKKFPFDQGDKLWTYRSTMHDSTQKRKRAEDIYKQLTKRQALDIWFVAADVQRPGAIQLELNTGGDILISQTIDSVCPEIKSVTRATGCYNCDIAPSVVVTARSTCMEGSASTDIQGQGLVPLSGLIHLESGYQNYTVKFDSIDKSVRGQLCLRADTRSACVNITGTLTEKVVNMTNNPMMMGNNTMTMGGSGAAEFFGAIGDAFVHVFNGIGDALEWVKVIATIVIGLIVTGLVLWVATKLWALRPKAKHQKMT